MAPPSPLTDLVLRVADNAVRNSRLEDKEVIARLHALGRTATPEDVSAYRRTSTRVAALMGALAWATRSGATEDARSGRSR